MDLAVANFKAASVDTSFVPGTGIVSVGEAISSKGVALMNLEVVLTVSVPTPADESEANAIEMAVANLVCDWSSSYPSASHAVNAPSLAGSDGDTPLVGVRVPPSFGVASCDVEILLAVPGAMPSEVKSSRGNGPTSLVNQPSAAVITSRTEESSSPPKSGSSDILHLG